MSPALKIILTRVKSALAVTALAAGAAGGLALAVTPAASAATPSCGAGCLDIFSKNFGTFRNPQFVLDAYKQGQSTGQPVILFRQSNSDPAEDFTIASEGQVSDFFAAGLVSPEVMLHYGCTPGLVISNGQGGTLTCTATQDDWAFEVEYAPYGADTGLCVGTGSAAVNGTKVSLQPCGVSSKTLWIADTLDSCLSNPLYKDEVPAVNGSDTNFSHPYVLTYPGSSYPADSPRPQLFTQSLTGFSQSGGGTCGGGSVNGVSSNQLWSARTGVLP